MPPWCLRAFLPLFLSMPRFHSQLTQSQHFSPIMVSLLSLYSSTNPQHSVQPALVVCFHSRRWDHRILKPKESSAIICSTSFLQTKSEGLGPVSLLLANSDLIQDLCGLEFPHLNREIRTASIHIQLTLELVVRGTDTMRFPPLSARTRSWESFLS